MKKALIFSASVLLLLLASADEESFTYGRLATFGLSFALLGLPLVLLRGVQSEFAGQPAAKVAAVLLAIFVIIDIPLFLGAGMAAPIVGGFQLLLSGALALVAWLVRRAA